MHLHALAIPVSYMQPDFEIWLDNQLPSHLAKWIQDEFNFVVRSAYTLQIQTSSDWQIHQTAVASEKLIIIVSKDGDFPKIIGQAGTPPKLIKLNTGNMPIKELWHLLQPILQEAITILTTTDTEIIFIEPTDH